jgi:ABC-type amino acid transport substrate-binding protein
MRRPFSFAVAASHSVLRERANMPKVLTLAIVAFVLAGCARGTVPQSFDFGASGVVIITAAPGAGGPLSYRNCPTLAEAKAAIPALVGGPDANAVPFKMMVLQCVYTINELDVPGRPAGIDILIFDASAEGNQLWDSVRTDPGFPNANDIPGLSDVAFATGTSGQNDVWVVQGGYGFHMSHTRQTGIPLDQMVALARAMLTGLERAPR